MAAEVFAKLDDDQKKLVTDKVNRKTKQVLDTFEACILLFA